MLSPHVPDLGALELLLTIGRTGSLGAAAREHGLSQPAVSLRLQSMERVVGLSLVERSSRGSTLTPTGSLLADWARGVVGAAETLDAGLVALREQRDARLRLAASLTVAEYLLPGWLVDLHRQRPGTSVALTAVNSVEVIRLVREAAVELGFVEGPGPPAGVSSRTVARDRLVVVVAAGHRWARPGALVTPTELAATPLVQREVNSGTRAALETALARVVVGPLAPPLLELSTAAGVRAAAVAGAAPAVLSSLAVREDLAAGRLVEVLIRGLHTERQLRAIWTRGARPVGAARELLTLIARGPRFRQLGG